MCVGSLYDFDKYGIPDAAVEKMQGIISDDDFQPEKLAPVSKAAAALSIWCKWRNLLGCVAPKPLGCFMIVSPDRRCDVSVPRDGPEGWSEAGAA